MGFLQRCIYFKKKTGNFEILKAHFLFSFQKERRRTNSVSIEAVRKGIIHSTCNCICGGGGGGGGAS